jgi:hypothetical protein
MVTPAPYPSNEQVMLESYLEEAQLRKADADIEAGRERLRDQEHLILSLQASGRPTMEAERLAALFRGTLEEWERHRSLIAGRLTYLRARLDKAARQA